MFRRQRQQLLDHRFLLHRVDEARVREINRRQLAFRIQIELRLHRADQLVEVRRIAEMHDLRDHLRAEAVQEAKALAADRGGFDLLALLFELLELLQRRAQHVRVQTAAQTLVSRDEDHAGRLHAVVRHHERVAVLRVRAAHVRGDGADLLRIRTSSAHAFLRAAHLRCGHHLHRLRDLARVLHALDLAANFLHSSHCLLLDRSGAGALRGPRRFKVSLADQ
ncbi:Uncharacterised protein [Burkholderia pseudomallei]|nr:Uncharacterised protein [Burkholderia pseudomallei]